MPDAMGVEVDVVLLLIDEFLSRRRNLRMGAAFTACFAVGIGVVRRADGTPDGTCVCCTAASASLEGIHPGKVLFCCNAAINLESPGAHPTLPAVTPLTHTAPRVRGLADSTLAAVLRMDEFEVVMVDRGWTAKAARHCR